MSTLSTVYFFIISFHYRFEQYTEKIKVDDIIYEVTLWDTAGQEEYERIRTLTYTRVKSSLLFPLIVFKHETFF